jgi:inner membrane protein
MNRSLAFKVAAVAFLALLLLIPLALIRGLVAERQKERDEVLEDIARSSSYAQRLTGPLLVVPYRKTVRQEKVHATTGQKYLESTEQRGRLYFLPERFALDGRIATEERRRGIYRARLYHSRNDVRGAFDLPARYGIEDDYADYRFDPALLTVGISDIRGIERDVRLLWSGQELPFAAGGGDDLVANGVHAVLPPLDPTAPQRFDFEFVLELQGTSQLSVSPVGRDTRVQLSSDWPHPSFVGDYLPLEREVGARGFTARWQTSFFATNLAQELGTCVRSGACDVFHGRGFGVRLVDPVDQYLKSERAVKYALLFVALTFAAFFLFEVLGRLAVHPVQYGLVGLALAVFYLLLLSLAEHVEFAVAYGVSAAACVLLIGFYVSHVLRGWRRGAGFTTGLTGLYGVLYGLLVAEDYALLMGALLVFGLLAAVMILTRRLDWYAPGEPARGRIGP